MSLHLKTTTRPRTVSAGPVVHGNVPILPKICDGRCIPPVTVKATVRKTQQLRSQVQEGMKQQVKREQPQHQIRHLGALTESAAETKQASTRTHTASFNNRVIKDSKSRSAMVVIELSTKGSVRGSREQPCARRHTHAARTHPLLSECQQDHQEGKLRKDMSAGSTALMQHWQSPIQTPAAQQSASECGRSEENWTRSTVSVQR
jgi:hypothetical protein